MEIKKKKTISSLDDEFIKAILDEQFRRNSRLLEKLAVHTRPLRSKEARRVIKAVRKKLHEVYGVFNLKPRNLDELKRNLEGNDLDYVVVGVHERLLLSHKSTGERLPYYEEIYKKIFSITGIPCSILDLASGLNPLSYPFMGLKKVRYIAVELSDEYCNFLNEYFGIMKRFGLDGTAVKKNLLGRFSFEKTDVCFLFKVLDTLEDLERNISGRILDNINARYIVVSFPRMSIGGRRRIKERGWFLKLLRKNRYRFNRFNAGDEDFFVLEC